MHKEYYRIVLKSDIHQNRGKLSKISKTKNHSKIKWDIETKLLPIWLFNGIFESI